ncbi:hypothetical protein H4R33_006391, partial [Dimargaris cristalligena]
THYEAPELRSQALIDPFTIASIYLEQWEPCLAVLRSGELTHHSRTLILTRVLEFGGSHRSPTIVRGVTTLLDQLNMWGQPRSFVFYTGLFQVYSRFEDHAAMATLWADLQRNPHSMGNCTLSVLIDCGRIHQFPPLAEVLESAAARGLEFNAGNFTSLVEYYCHTNNPQAVLTVLTHDMPQRCIAVDRKLMRHIAFIIQQFGSPESIGQIQRFVADTRNQDWFDWWNGACADYISQCREAEADRIRKENGR